jgi:glycosyltransferase involved in cell wall biosynthesis
MKVSVVVPCYNEGPNLKTVAERFGALIHDDSVQVVLVDNGSTDESPQIFKDFLSDRSRFPFFKTIRVEKNQGYGYGVLAGLNASDGDIVGWTHADLQTDPADVLRAANVFLQSPEPPRILVKGRRRKRPLADRVFSWGMQLLASALLKTWLSEINAQPKLFPRQLFLSWQDPPHDFSLDLYALVMAKYLGYKVQSIDVDFPPRQHGVSRWAYSLKGRFKMVLRTLKFIFELRRRISRETLRSG